MKEPSAKPRIVTGEFCLLFVANLMMTSVYYLMITVMAGYAIAAFGSSDSMAGLASSVFLIGSVFGRITAGRYATEFGLARCSVVGLLVMLLSCAMYFASGLGIGFLLAVRMLHGFTFGLAGTTLPSLAMQKMPKSRIGEGTGYYMISVSLGTAIGPMLGLFVTADFDYEFLFAICVAMMVVGAAAAIAVKGEPAGRPDPDRKASRSIAVSDFFDYRAGRFSLFVFFSGMAQASLNAFIGNHAAGLGMGRIAPFVFLVYAVALLVSRPAAGILLDRRGENAVMYPSIVATAIGCVVCAYAESPLALLCVGPFMAMGFGTSVSSGQAVVTMIADGRDTARAISTFYLLCDIGCGIGPFLMGFLVPIGGYRLMFTACACISLIGLAYYHFAYGRTVKRSII